MKYHRLKFILISGLLLFLSISASADMVRYAQYVYSALDRMENPTSTKYEQVTALMMTARHLTINSDTTFFIDRALSTIERMKRLEKLTGGEYQKTHHRMVVSYLRTSLMTNRLTLGGIFLKERELFERMILMALFPEHFGQVKLRFENLSHDRGLILLATYLMDIRAAKYDPEVAPLVTGRNLYGEKATSEIVFILPEERFDKTASSEILFSKMKQLITPGMAIVPKVHFYENQVVLFLEIHGLSYVPYIEVYLRNPLIIAGPNRYLFSTANGLELLARNLRAARVTDVKLLQLAALKSAGLVSSMEDMFRSRMMSGAWFNPNEETVRAILRSRALSDIQHMKKNLRRDLTQMEARGGAEAELQARRAKTTRWIEARRGVLKGQLGRLDGAIEKVRGSSDFGKLTTLQKSAAVLKEAEAVGKVRVITLDRVIKTVSFVLAGYYATEGAIQLFRLDDDADEERIFIYQHYGAKVIHALLYALPAAGEAAIAIDVGGWLLDTMVINWFGYDLPNVEEMLLGVFGWVEDVTLWLNDTDRFRLRTGELKMQLGIPLDLGTLSVDNVDQREELARRLLFYLMTIKSMGIFKEARIRSEEEKLYLRLSNI